MAKFVTDNFGGGLNLTNPNTIKDNQFEVLSNMFYSRSKRVETRRGIRNFGQPIPQSVVLIDACDATTGWAVGGDGANLATGTAIRGTNSLQFDIVASGGSTTLTKSTISADIVDEKGYLSIWVFVPTGFNTNLTSVVLKLGSDSSNYYSWTLPTLTENQNNFLILAYTSATLTGTPVDSSITYAQIVINYNGSYLNQTGIKIDSIYSYSSLSTKPVSSYFFDQRDDTGLRRALAWCGTNCFLYHEETGATPTTGYWEVIDTGLTEFETAEGFTTFRTRWSADTYRNVIYMCNGVDDYRSWNDVKITTFPSQPKVRYIKYLDDGDRMGAAGEDDNPITFYYTAAAALNAEAIDTNAVVIGGDQMGKINGLQSLGQVYVVGKDFKKYSVDVTNETSLPLDPEDGWYGHRTLKNVGRGILHLTRRGIEQLEARNALSGPAAMASESLTDDLRPLMQSIGTKYLNSSAAAYNENYTNYYFTGDTSADDIPDTTIVRSSLTNAWSQYSWPALYDYGGYVDADYLQYFLGARATSGQMLEMEYGFNDVGGSYLCELKTKAWDFNDPRTWKDFEGVSISGLKSLGKNITVEVIVDGSVVYMAEITDSQIFNTSVPADSVGVYPIGTLALSGAASGTTELPLYRYQVTLAGTQFASGYTIQVKMYSNTTSFVWTLDQMQLFYQNNVFDLIPTDNFI